MPDSATDPQTEAHEERQLGQMGIMQHLEELRKRIIVSLLAVAVSFGVGWYYAEKIFALMEKPIKTALANNHYAPILNYVNPTGPFNLYLKIGLYAGIFISSPVILYQLWMFISPGLYRRAKRFVLPFLFLSVGLFLSGGVFCFRGVYPVGLDFLFGYAQGFNPGIMADGYPGPFFSLCLGLGLVFGRPVWVGLLGEE